MKGFILRLSPEEFELLKKQVKNSGMNRQEYLRNLCKKVDFKPCPTNELADIYPEIKEVSDEINRITKLANGTGIIDEPAYKRAMDKLREILSRVVEHDL